MTSSLNDWIGKEVRRVVFHVEPGKIAEFARAIRDPAPIYFDQDDAVAAGYGGIVAPLTFSTASAHYAGGDAAEVPLKLGLDLTRTVHGEHTWTLLRPITAGETLLGVSVVTDADVKTNRKGQQMRRIWIETVFTDLQGEPVVKELMLTVELPAPSS